MVRIRGRIRRRDPSEGTPEAEEYVEIDPSQLTGVFAAPNWLRDIGITAWLLVGVALALVGAVWLLALTEVIVVPVITAAVVASVASPLVGWLHRHRIPRPLGAAMVLLGIVAISFTMVLIILGGITSELDGIKDQLNSAKSEISGWANDLGVGQGQANDATADASSTINDAGQALLNGLVGVASELSSLAFFLAMTVLSLFFLLADGPKIRKWAEKSMGVPLPVAQVVTQRMLGALRGYFLGVTIVAAFSAVVVTIGGLILGAPLLGTIAIVTFLGGYIPYLGAWSAGAFAVLLTLGGAGPEAAAGMIVIQLLANSVLQQLVQPFAMGAALGIHPLAVLIVTIAGGALFGAVGLILAAPVVSAVTRISADLARAREPEETTSTGEVPAHAT
jgi:predicted PurR-regulated permease PerM